MQFFDATTVEEVKNLIALGLNVNCQRGLETPLINACKKGNFDIVKVLCEAGAYNSNSICTVLNPPAYVAAEEDYLDIVKFFVTNYSPNLNKLLEISIINGSTDILDFLLTLDINLNYENNNPLMLACRNAQIDSVDRLLNAGANPNIAPAIIKEALVCNRLDIIQKLVAYGADFNHVSNEETPLVLSSKLGFTDISKFLIELGCDINFSDKNMRTPLMFACKNNNLEIVKLLLKYGANAEHADVDDKKAVDYCTSDEVKACFI